MTAAADIAYDIITARAAAQAGERTTRHATPRPRVGPSPLEHLIVTAPDAPPCEAPAFTDEKCDDAAYVRVLIGSGSMAVDGIAVCGRCSRRMRSRYRAAIVGPL